MTLKEYRKSLGLTQTQLAERLGVSYQAYQQWENGRKKPGAEALMKFAEKLRLVITIKPDTREFSVMPEQMWKDPTEGKTPEEIMNTYSYMWVRKYKWKVDRDGKQTNVPIDMFNHGIDGSRYYAIMKLSRPDNASSMMSGIDYSNPNSYR